MENKSQTWQEISNEIHASKKRLKAKQQRFWGLFVAVFLIALFAERSSNPFLFIVVIAGAFIILCVSAPWGKVAEPTEKEVKEYAKNQLKTCRSELDKLNLKIQKFEEIV